MMWMKIKLKLSKFVELSIDKVPDMQRSVITAGSSHDNYLS